MCCGVRGRGCHRILNRELRRFERSEGLSECTITRGKRVEVRRIGTIRRNVAGCAVSIFLKCVIKSSLFVCFARGSTKRGPSLGGLVTGTGRGVPR